MYETCTYIYTPTYTWHIHTYICTYIHTYGTYTHVWVINRWLWYCVPVVWAYDVFDIHKYIYLYIHTYIQTCTWHIYKKIRHMNRFLRHGVHVILAYDVFDEHTYIYLYIYIHTDMHMAHIQKFDTWIDSCGMACMVYLHMMCLIYIRIYIHICTHTYRHAYGIYTHAWHMLRFLRHGVHVVLAYDVFDTHTYIYIYIHTYIHTYRQLMAYTAYCIWSVIQSQPPI